MEANKHMKVIIHTMQSRRHRCLRDVEAAVKKDQREDRQLPAGDS